ncbi:MAG: hypothetical protein ACRDOP_01305, partial [Gaiellaceae bacterium]
MNPIRAAILEQRDDGRTLTLEYDLGDPACEQFDRVEGIESSSVSLVVVLQVSNERPCGDILRVRGLSKKAASGAPQRSV